MKGIRREANRKLIHIASIAVPWLVWLVPRTVAIAFLVPLVAIALLTEWARVRLRWVRYHFLRRTRTLLRSHERRGPAGATYMIVAYLLALLLFPKPVAVAAMLYNGLGDAAAALVGRRWGRRRTSWGKSWEGFAAALIVNLMVGFAVPGVPLPGVLIGAFVAAALEFAPLPLDDNLRVTLGGGAGIVAGIALGRLG